VAVEAGVAVARWLRDYVAVVVGLHDWTMAGAEDILCVELMRSSYCAVSGLCCLVVLCEFT